MIPQAIHADAKRDAFRDTAHRVDGRRIAPCRAPREKRSQTAEAPQKSLAIRE
jgi:hypothetical protein